MMLRVSGSVGDGALRFGWRDWRIALNITVLFALLLTSGCIFSSILRAGEAHCIALLYSKLNYS